MINNLYAKYRSEKSYFGYDPAVLKSGIQKYGRRAEIEKGLWCLVEMDSFSMLEWNGTALNDYLAKYPGETRINTQTSARRIRTNMVNRLVVMMSEEVNISAWWMPLKIMELRNKWLENRGNLSSQKFLVDMYLTLTSQRMIRLISDLHSVYLLPPDYVKAKHMNTLMRIYGTIQRRYPGIYSAQAKVGQLNWTVPTSKYPVAVQRCVQGIIYNLEIGCDHVFFWIKQLRDLEKQDKVPEYRYLNIVWAILDRFINRNKDYGFVRNVTHALHAFYKSMTHKEKPIYLYHAVLLLVRRNEIDWDAEPSCIDIPIADVQRLYRNHLAGGKMAMDEFVFDLHAIRGKKRDGCLENFAREGAYVKNENTHFLNPAYREIYILLKQELDFFHSKGGK